MVVSSIFQTTRFKIESENSIGPNETIVNTKERKIASLLIF